MQNWFVKHWDEVNSNDPVEVDDPGDFGFFDVEAIKKLGPAYYYSGHNPNHLPRPGGILRQTQAIQHDLALYLHGIAWRRWLKFEADQTDDLSG